MPRRRSRRPRTTRSDREPATAPRLDRLLVVVGVEFEARALRRRLRRLDARAGSSHPELILRAVGVGAGALDGLGAHRGRDRPDAVLVTGLAGGCGPSVTPGTVILANAVGAPGGGDWVSPDSGLFGRAEAALAAAGLPYRVGRLLTASSIVATPEDKAACWRAHAALAVDMESAHVLAWARQVGLPALAVRAVADGPHESLPPALAAAIGGRGDLRLGTVLGWARQPALLGSAWRLWRRSRMALDGLARFLNALARLPVDP